MCASSLSLCRILARIPYASFSITDGGAWIHFPLVLLVAVARVSLAIDQDMTPLRVERYRPHTKSIDRSVQEAEPSPFAHLHMHIYLVQKARSEASANQQISSLRALSPLRLVYSRARCSQTPGAGPAPTTIMQVQVIQRLYNHAISSAA